MKFNPKAAHKEQIMNMKKLTPEAEQRRFDSFCKQLEAMLMPKGFKKEEVAQLIASKGDPLQMTIAIASAQMALEQRKSAPEA